MGAILCLVPQSCPILGDPMNCSPPCSSVHGDSPGKNTEIGYHTLLQGIFLTKGSNPGLLHCRQFFTIWTTREAVHIVFLKWVSWRIIYHLTKWVSFFPLYSNNSKCFYSIHLQGGLKGKLGKKDIHNRCPDTPILSI